MLCSDFVIVKLVTMCGGTSSPAVKFKEGALHERYCTLNSYPQPSERYGN